MLCTTYQTISFSFWNISFYLPSLKKEIFSYFSCTFSDIVPVAMTKRKKLVKKYSNASGI